MTVDAFPTVPDRELRRRSVRNLLRMGHCAPAVMQTLLDASDTEARWLVTLTAGLPGGIGNTGGECGGLTAPLVLLGLRHPRADMVDGLPRVLYVGHALLQTFTAGVGTTQCRSIRGDARLPLRCIGVVRQSPAMCARCLDAATGDDPIPAEAQRAYRELYAHWRDRGFHCADAVLAAVGPDAPDELHDAVTAFMGGTLLTGGTCSALTAGVMALGLAVDDIEDSYRRVARMIATMALGGDAFADDLNAFSRAMNLGHELATWFEAEFGSTRCRQLTGVDFSAADGVRVYIGRDGTTDCARIAERTAARAAAMIDALTRR